MEVIVQGKKFPFDNGQGKFLAKGAVSLAGGLVAVDEVELTPDNAAYHIAEFERFMDTRTANLAFAEEVLRNISDQITITNLAGWPRRKYLLKKAVDTALSKAFAAPLVFCAIGSLLDLLFLIFSPF